MSNIFASTLVDTADHHPMLRDSVAKLVGSFGRSYFQDMVKRNVKPVELWNAMGEAGFLGVHIAEEYGGGGSGLADYNVIVEEAAAQGCPMLRQTGAPIRRLSAQHPHPLPWDRTPCTQRS